MYRQSFFSGSFGGVLRAAIVAGAMAATTLSAGAEGKTLRFAFQGTLNALDPYSLN